MNLFLLKAISGITCPVVNLVAKRYDVSENVKSIKNVPYSGTGGKENRMDIHFVERTAEPLPVVVYLHGGGWALGDKSVNTGFCKKLADEGFLVFNVNYGLGPKYHHPEPLYHIIAAINWIKSNSQKYNGDTNKFFLAGDSAGAHLASLTACVCTNKWLEESLKVTSPLSKDQLKGLLLYYGAYNFETLLETGFPLVYEAVLSYIGTTDIKNYPLKGQISPIHHVTEDFPPVFITSGETDMLHKTQTLEMIKVLESKGIWHEKLLFDTTMPGGRHGFQQMPWTRCAREACSAAIRFMQECCKTR